MEIQGNSANASSSLPLPQKWIQHRALLNLGDDTKVGANKKAFEQKKRHYEEGATHAPTTSQRICPFVLLLFQFCTSVIYRKC